MIDIPILEAEEQAQDQYNRQVVEALAEAERRLDYIKAIPDTLTTVPEIIAYLKGV